MSPSSDPENPPPAPVAPTWAPAVQTPAVQYPYARQPQVRPPTSRRALAVLYVWLSTLAAGLVAASVGGMVAMGASGLWPFVPVAALVGPLFALIPALVLATVAAGLGLVPNRVVATALVTTVALPGALLSVGIGAGIAPDAGWGFAAGLFTTAVLYLAFTAVGAWYATAPR